MEDWYAPGCSHGHSGARLWNSQKERKEERARGLPRLYRAVIGRNTASVSRRVSMGKEDIEGEMHGTREKEKKLNVRESLGVDGRGHRAVFRLSLRLSWLPTASWSF